MSSAPTLASDLDSRVTVRMRLTAVAQTGGLVLVILLLAIVFQAFNPVFLSQGNLIEIFRSGSLYFVVACASTLILVGGGLDFSIGATFPLGGIVAGAFMLAGVPWPLA